MFSSAKQQTRPTKAILSMSTNEDYYDEQKDIDVQNN